MENQTGTTESTPTGDAATDTNEVSDLGSASAGSSEGRSSGFDAAAAEASIKPTLGSPKGESKAPAPKAPAAPTPAERRKYALKVDGQEVARTTVRRTVPAAFSASETFDVGVDLGSTVSLDYFDRRPFRFDGSIASVKVELK